MSQAHGGAVATGVTPSALGYLKMPWRRRRATARIAANAILDSLDLAVVGQDPDGIIATWSSSAERRYGFSAHEVVGRPMKSLVPSTSWRWEDRAVKASLGGLSDTYETERLAKDGGVRGVTVQMSPIKNSAG